MLWWWEVEAWVPLDVLLLAVLVTMSCIIHLYQSSFAPSIEFFDWIKSVKAKAVAFSSDL